MKRKLILSILFALLLTAGLFLIASADEAPCARIAGHNLNVTDHVEMIYYVTFDSDPEDYDDSGVLVFTSEKETYTYDTADAILAEGDDPYVTARATYHKYYYAEIADYQMTDVFYACPYYKIGENVTYGAIDTYSVLQYAMEQSGKTGCDPNPRLAGILEWLLNEGTAAQIAENYHTERLANGTYGYLTVEGGMLPGGLSRGCFAVGDEVTMTGLGGTIGWYNEANERIAAGATYRVTVTAEPQCYRAVCEAHNFVEELVSAATCTSPALYRRVCTCGAQDGELYAVGEALGHVAVVDPAVAATCTETGLTAGTHCSRCGAVLIAQEVLPAAGGHLEVADAAVAPTCTETGLTAGSHCATCGTVLIAQEVVPALGHDYDEGEVVTAPTCVNGGTLNRTCSRCGDVVIEPIPATGHDFSSMVVDNAHYAGLTCNQTLYYYSCSVCGEIGSETFGVAGGDGYHSGHSTCDACGITLGLTYTSNGDGTCTLTGMTTAETIEKLKIPSTSPNGDRVTAIGANAFSGRTDLVSVMIPEGVTTIGNGAFANCSALSSVVLPSSLASVGMNAFKGNISLIDIYYCTSAIFWEQIEFSSGNEAIGGATLYYYSASTPVAAGEFWHYVRDVITVWPPFQDNYGPLVPLIPIDD